MSDDERKGREFLEAALNRGLIDRGQYLECFKIAKQLEDMGLAESLADLAVKKGFISADDRHALLKELEHDEQVFPFDVGEEIGRGAIGVVYRALQKSLERPVAVKVLKPEFARDPKYVEQFLKEARASAKFNHVNVIQGIDAGPYKDSYYFAMELVEGPPLGEIIRKRKRLNIDEALSIALQIARALEFAEKLKLVHRDIKPDNILIGKDGTAKLCDLGMARLTVSEDVIKAGVAVGTPYYMSPEQARGQTDIDIRADLYSLGATLYHMLVGAPPFHRLPVDEVLRRHLTGSIPDPREKNPKVSSNLALVIAKLMAKDPRRRYHLPLEIQRDLELVSSGRSPRFAADFKGESTIKLRLDAKRVARRFGPYIAAAAAMALLVAAAVVVGVVMSRDGTRTDDTPPLPYLGSEIPVVRPAPPSAPEDPPSLPEDDELVRLKHGYEEILATVRARPTDFVANIDLLEEFIEEAKGSPYAELAKERLADLRKLHTKAEKNRLAQYEKEVSDLLKKGKLEQARTRIHDLFTPDMDGKEALKLKDRLFEEVTRNEVAAWRRYADDIDKFIDARNFDAARKAANKAMKAPQRFIRDRASLTFKRIAKAEKDWRKHLQEQAEKKKEQRRKEADAAFDRFVVEYAGLFASSSLDQIPPLTDKFSRSYPELKPRLQPFVERYPAWVNDTLSTALEGLSSQRGLVTITWRDRPLKGTPTGRRGDTVLIQTTGGPEFPVKVEDLALSDILSFAGLLSPKEEADRLAAAAVALSYADERRFQRFLNGLEGADADLLRRLHSLSQRSGIITDARDLLERADKAFAARTYSAAEAAYRELLQKHAELDFVKQKRAYLLERIYAAVALGADPFNGIFEGKVKILAEDHFLITYDYTGGTEGPTANWQTRDLWVNATEKGLRAGSNKHGSLSFKGLGFVSRLRAGGVYYPGKGKDDKPGGWLGLSLGGMRYRLWATGGGGSWLVTEQGEWDKETRQDFRGDQKQLKRIDYEVTHGGGKIRLLGGGKSLIERDYKGPGMPAMVEIDQSSALIEQLAVEGYLADWFVRTLIVRNHYDQAKGKKDGVRAAFYSDRAFKRPHEQKERRNLDFHYPAAPLPGMPEDGFSIRLRGLLVVPDDGEFVFYSRGSGTFRLSVDGKVTLLRKSAEGQAESKPLRLRRGVVSLTAEYVDSGGDADNRVEWKGPAFNRRSVPDEAFLRH